MTGRQPTWRAVADALAARLVHHARCPVHSAAEANPADCPFCDDRAAYQLWVAKTREESGR